MYVQRDKDGKIVGQFTHFQEGFAEEFVDDNNAILKPTNQELLAQAKTQAISTIATAVKAKRASIAGTTDDAEIAGWSNKLRIAQAINDKTASNEEKAAFQAELNARGVAGETLTMFTQKVITNAALFAQVAGVLDGLKRKGRDAITASTTLEQVDIALSVIKTQIESI